MRGRVLFCTRECSDGVRADGLIPQNVFIDWFQKVNFPAKSSIYCPPLLIEILSWRSCLGVDFLKLINEYVVSDEDATPLDRCAPRSSTPNREWGLGLMLFTPFSGQEFGLSLWARADGRDTRDRCARRSSTPSRASPPRTTATTPGVTRFVKCI